jgi:hypothetical protein
MRPAEPRITTRTTPGAITVEARYEAPETARAIASLRAGLANGTSALGAVAAAALLIHHPATLADGERLVVWFALCGGIVGLARLGARLASDRRFGLRGLTDHGLVVTLSRDDVRAAGRSFPRTMKIAFTSEPHRLGRREERAERTSGHTLPETYRLAHEVRLQHGEDFVVLAAVASEDAANVIVRRLQSADEEATRGTGAMSRGAAFGHRQVPA